MKLVDVDSLSLVLLFPLLASAVVAATPVRVARVLAGVAGVVGGALAVGHAVACATIGGFGDQAGGGYVGARLVARWVLPGFSLPLELEPLTAPLLLAAGVVTGAGIVGLALRGGGRGALTASLLIQAGLVATVVVGTIVGLVGAFVSLGMLATLAPLTSLGARPAGNAALRAFAVQRVGDGALIVGMMALATSLGGLGFEQLLTVPLDVDAWSRVADVGLFGGLPPPNLVVHRRQRRRHRHRHPAGAAVLAHAARPDGVQRSARPPRGPGAGRPPGGRRRGAGAPAAGVGAGA
jgi:hypothetical protein